MEPRIKFVRPVRNGLVSTYQIEAMEAELAKLGVSTETYALGWMRQNVSRAVKHLNLVRSLPVRRRSQLLIPILRRSEGDAFPWCYYSEVIPWSFDCWPGEYDKWESFFRRIRVRLAFVSARESAREMQRRLPSAKIVWSPEAVDPSIYNPLKSLSERSISVLELGRRHEAFHQVLLQPLADREWIHLFEKTRGLKIFRTRDELTAGYGDSKVSVCFPASVTDPSSSGGLETATYRYFESIASKCVLYGHAPAELVELFGFNPVIEAPPDLDVSHLIFVLRNIEDYQDMVEANYARLLEVGTWSVRAREILANIQLLRESSE